MCATIAASSRREKRMVQGVKLRKAGGSIAATLPKDMADRLKLAAGDSVIAIETERGILLTPYDSDTEEALRVATEVGRNYRNALRELAK
jgi:putative addiction module antidote